MDKKKEYPKTYECLMQAFSGESQARNKYDFFAKVARKEGHQNLGDFFEETARNEQEHAKLLYNILVGVGNTSANLKTAAEGEHYENVTMYPDFAKIAKEEGFKEAQNLFENLQKIEKVHAKKFEAMLKKLENNTLYTSESGKKIVWVCQKCGHIENSIDAPQKCPVCNHPQGYFKQEVKV